ncbi:hypothetical protein E2562_032432 [Oryza meyeriana var. granulata]|uniref:Uncharacterized protein n=1 Tax=Oryza meyeriana var. granulata TaxID=110450 RepID=A0A6G1E6B8_9ORYZ|nr:hypothetical protein E2562_032432 [Oryza meyeriana var. granulata]
MATAWLLSQPTAANSTLAPHSLGVDTAHASLEADDLFAGGVPLVATPVESSVSRRWYAFLRTSITSLALRLPVSFDASVMDRPLPCYLGSSWLELAVAPASAQTAT